MTWLLYRIQEAFSKMLFLDHLSIIYEKKEVKLESAEKVLKV